MRATTGNAQAGANMSTGAAGARSFSSLHKDCAIIMSPTHDGPTINVALDCTGKAAAGYAPKDSR